MYSYIQGFYYLSLLKPSINAEVVYVCWFVQTRSQCHNLNPPQYHHHMCVCVRIYHSLDATVAQSKNCPFGVNTEIELKNITTPDSTGIWRGMFQLRSVPVLSDVFDIFLGPIIVLTEIVNFSCASIAFGGRYILNRLAEVHKMSIGWCIPEVLQDVCCTPETRPVHWRSYFCWTKQQWCRLSEYAPPPVIIPPMLLSSTIDSITQPAALASLWQVPTTVCFPKERTLINIACKDNWTILYALPLVFVPALETCAWAFVLVFHTLCLSGGFSPLICVWRYLITCEWCHRLHENWRAWIAFWLVKWRLI